MNYTIATEPNSYFQGRDAVLFKDGDERVATLALKDEGPAVKVKHGYSFGTAETRAMRAELPEDRFDALVGRIAQDFWEDLAPEIARKHGFEEVYQEGRSGGWCVPHPNPVEWWECISIVPAHGQNANAVMARTRYFDFAVEITALVESLRTGYFDDRVREEHAEWLVEKAEQAVEESRRFSLFMGDDDEGQSTLPEAWDYELTRGAVIERVTDALRSIDEGGFVIRVNMEEVKE